MNVIINPMIYCDLPTLAGIEKLWVAQRDWFGRFWYYEETSNLQYGKILGAQSNTKVQQWYEIIFRPVDASFTQTQTLTPSRNYTQTLTVSFNQMDINKRDTFEQFVVCKNPVFIFKDLNGKYWLLGETNGCDVEWQGKTDAIGGINDYQLTLSCIERYPIREVDSNYIESNDSENLEHLCSLSWADLCSRTWQELCELPW